MEKSMDDKSNESKAVLVIIMEILFALMPLGIIFLITLLTSKNILSIFKRSDISFIAVFLFGQTLVRVISGIVNSRKHKKWQIVAFIISLLFLLGVIPSVILLIIVYTETSISNLVYILQNIWLTISIATYFIFGSIGQMYLDENNTDDCK
jgi:hypothetical protein